MTTGLSGMLEALTGSAVALIVVLGVGVPFIYIHVIEGSAPPPLALSSQPAGAASSSGTSSSTASEQPAKPASLTGSYEVASGSQAGYRVKEVLAGQHATAVGRTGQVSGSMRISGDTVESAAFTVDMASVKSDRSERDNQFRGRIMDTSKYPTGSFKLTKPMTLVGAPQIGKVVTETAVGELTLHGTAKPVSLQLHAERTSSGVQVTGTTTITYGDYGIGNPSFGSFVSVGSSGSFEVLLNLAKT